MKTDGELLAEKVSLINPHYRRLDILSQMLEGADQAASLCFDGENLLFACNKPKRIPLQTEIMQHLINIANIDYNREDHHEIFIKFHNDLMDKANSFYSEYKYGRDGVKLSQDWLLEFKNNLQRVEGSIAAFIAKTNPSILNNLRTISTEEMIREDAAFEPGLVRALQEGKIIDLNDTGKVHAELRIVDRLLQAKKIQKGEQFYISTSKKCCANCEAAIKSVNHVFQREDGSIQNSYGIHSSLSTNQPVITRDLLTEGHGHGVRYGASDVPNFMKKNSTLRTEDKNNIISMFLDITGHKNIGEAFATKPAKVNAGYLGPIKSISPTSRQKPFDTSILAGKTAPRLPDSFMSDEGTTDTEISPVKSLKSSESLIHFDTDTKVTPPKLKGINDEFENFLSQKHSKPKISILSKSTGHLPIHQSSQSSRMHASLDEEKLKQFSSEESDENIIHNIPKDVRRGLKNVKHDDDNNKTFTPPRKTTSKNHSADI